MSTTTLQCAVFTMLLEMFKLIKFFWIGNRSVIPASTSLTHLEHVAQDPRDYQHNIHLQMTSHMDTGRTDRTTQTEEQIVKYSILSLIQSIWRWSITIFITFARKSLFWSFLILCSQINKHRNTDYRNNMQEKEQADLKEVWNGFKWSWTTHKTITHELLVIQKGAVSWKTKSRMYGWVCKLLSKKLCFS